jgi:hypothetical protein
MGNTPASIYPLLQKFAASQKERLALQRRVQAMDEAEKQLAAEILDLARNPDGTIPTLSGIYEDGLSYKMGEIPTPVVVDWPSTLNWIKENRAVDLLQKRLTESAVKLRWEEGITIPGVISSNKPYLKVGG